MPLTSGIKLGPYEILSPLGAGGMGEVWKAKDTRLDRFVAIKVLPEHLVENADALARFEREAKAVAALNHPNILSIFDIGKADDTAYAVMELLEGGSLRDRLAQSPLPPRKATELAIQMASGLAAAHEKGVIHRDLKPENLWITKDGRLKILDFGLAKIQVPFLSSTDATQALHRTPQASPHETEKGMILGTVAYMSPEQARGEILDSRTDLFSFGVVLWEMVTGKPLFEGSSAIETLNAILTKEPPELEPSLGISPGLIKVLDHCLQKAPGQRFQSSRDLVFALENLSSGSGSSTSFKAATTAHDRKTPWIWAASAAAALLTMGFAGWAMNGGRRPEPSFQRLTFQRGTVETARFAFDGKTIVYSARWQGGPPELFTIPAGSPESRPLGLGNASFLSISPTNELAVQLSPRLWAGLYMGKLARVPMGGGGTRDIQEDILRADWNPVTGELAMTIESNTRWRLESPPGKRLYEGTLYLDHPRFSRRDGNIAFFKGRGNSDWSIFPEPGEIVLVDPAGEKRLLAASTSCTGLAWTAKGDEVWYTECLDGSQTRLWGVALSGKRRLIWSAVGFLAIQDIALDGRLLMLARQVQDGVLGLTSSAVREQDLSIFDGSSAADISKEGRTLLINEAGSGGGKDGSFFLRLSDGSSAVKLGKGSAMALSPDGTKVLARHLDDPNHLYLVPTGTGQTQVIQLPGFEDLRAGWFLPDGHRIVFWGRKGSEALRHFLLNLEGGAPRPLTPEGTILYQGLNALSPDGRFLATHHMADRGMVNEVYPVEGGEPSRIPGMGPRDIAIRWSDDGHSIFVFDRESLPARIFRLDLATGKKQLVKEFMPADPGGIAGVNTIAMTGDARTFAFNYRRRLSDLFVLEGLK